MKLLNLLTFTFILIITNFALFAQNNTKKITNNNKNIYFEVSNKTTPYTFSATDARKLEKYLISNNKITNCDQEALSVMLETENGQHNIVQDLYKS